MPVAIALIVANHSGFARTWHDVSRSAHWAETEVGTVRGSGLGDHGHWFPSDGVDLVAQQAAPVR
jgi:hypothetical protein